MKLMFMPEQLMFPYPGKPPTMEELAEKLNVPLETIDDQTRSLLSNLTKQLGLVARQSAPVHNPDAVPPELRANRSHVPPELRNEAGPSSRPDNASAHVQDRPVPHQSRPRTSTSSSTGGLLPAPSNNDSANNGSEDYCTSYPPPDMEERRSSGADNNRVSSSERLTVDYSHGRNRDRGDAVSGDTMSSTSQNGVNSRASSSGGTSTATASSLKDKVQGYGSRQGAGEISSRSSSNERAGNGFIPRQLQSQRHNSSNSYDRSANQNRSSSNQPRPSLNQQRPLLGPRPGVSPMRPNQPRKW